MPKSGLRSTSSPCRAQLSTITGSTKRKLSLLQLAEELGNVSKACKIMGDHRDTFCEVRRAFQIDGVAAIVEKKRGPKHPHPNRVPAGTEEKILALCLEQPTYGAQRIATELRRQNVLFIDSLLSIPVERRSLR